MRSDCMFRLPPRAERNGSTASVVGVVEPAETDVPASRTRLRSYSVIPGISAASQGCGPTGNADADMNSRPSNVSNTDVATRPTENSGFDGIDDIDTLSTPRRPTQPTEPRPS